MKFYIKRNISVKILLSFSIISLIVSLNERLSNLKKTNELGVSKFLKQKYLI